MPSATSVPLLKYHLLHRDDLYTFFAIPSWLFSFTPMVMVGVPLPQHLNNHEVIRTK
ncbi:uncharacterized protein METZ01_LOCUS157228 [marine metagenome]|uniref:Uncharacterized protein n=1 Tax=marine metagenome TaxID=408172 RepID=A0A382ASQ3_9ZZZZ